MNHQPGLSIVRTLALASTLLACQASETRGMGFTDVTLQSGLTHVQSTSEQIQNLAGTAFMTGGVAAGDFDGDGFTDLVFTRLNDRDIYYRNLGDGTFAARTDAAGFYLPTLTNGLVSGDVDNDGDLDLYMNAMGDTRNFLYLNDGNGYFTDVGTTEIASLANGQRRFGQGASFGDYDNDGYLDLATGDWGNWDASSQSRLLRNRGALGPGQFDDLTSAAGINTYRNPRTFRFSPRFVDLDRDGHLDLTFASDFGTSQLFWNNGDGTFTDGTVAAGVGTDRNGMGTTFGDYDNDGDLDWFITNITEAPNVVTAFGGWNRLYRNDGDRRFTDVTQEAGVRDARWAWGTAFLDFDNDGDLDLMATNGFNGQGWTDDRTVLWQNDGGVYTDVSASLGIVDRQQGRGLAYLDFDRDGDLDVVIVNNQAAPVLYRNDGGNSNHFLRINPQGSHSNRDGIGAWITITPDIATPERQLVWEIDGGSSFLSQSERTAHFGLGNQNDPVDMVSIRWSSGIVQLLFNIPVDQTVLVVETDQWLLADFNGDEAVDAADYTLWRDTHQSATHLQADGSANGLVGWEDLALWQANYGRTSRSAAPQWVPEPSRLNWLLFCLFAPVVVHGRQRGSCANDAHLRPAYDGKK